MADVPILSGIVTDLGGDYRDYLPLNLVPVAVSNGISGGYLRPANGIVERGEGSGRARGATVWKDTLYVVQNGDFSSVASDGTVTRISNIQTGDRASLAGSFDHLAIATDGRLYLFDGTSEQRVNDADLGEVIDVDWTGGYFVFTDGEFIATTDLDDPFSVTADKYTSSEASPDPILAVKVLSNEVYAVNRHTTEVFQNVGGTGFPFQRIETAQIEKGCVGTYACLKYLDQLAIVGGGMHDAVAVWLMRGGSPVKLSTREIDKRLAELTESELAAVYLTQQVADDQAILHVHLPNETLAYDAAASARLERPVWHRLQSNNQIWRASTVTYAYGEWWVGDTNSGKIGVFDTSTSRHWQRIVDWSFATPIIYAGGNSAQVHRIELVGLPGRAALGRDPFISTKYSADGITWSQPKRISAGKIGERTKRLTWFQQGPINQYRIQRFDGTSDAHLTVSALNFEAEALAI